MPVAKLLARIGAKPSKNWIIEGAMNRLVDVISKKRDFFRSCGMGEENWCRVMLWGYSLRSAKGVEVERKIANEHNQRTRVSLQISSN